MEDIKYCPHCGKELPVESSFCPYCMTKFNTETASTMPQPNQPNGKKPKKLVIICASAVLAAAVLAAGIAAAVPALSSNTAPTSASVESSAAESAPKDQKSDNGESSKGENSKAEKTDEDSKVDNGVGLRNVKVDSDSLTDENQKLVAQYFDNDYIDITNYEFLARYPAIFENSQICFTGTIQKLIKSTDTEYEALVWVGKNEANYYYRNSDMGMSYDEYKKETKDNLIIIKGKQTDTRLITGDDIVGYGRYLKISTTEIDGTSYTIPTVNTYRTFFNESLSSPDKFDANFIKKVAKVIFGSDIEVRNAKDGDDYDSSQGMMNCNFDDYPFMVCEPENQSNAKFTKYRMYMKQGVIEDAKSRSSVSGTGTDVDDSEIIRQFEFAPDFKHYLVYTFDTSLNSMSVGYYDSDFKKIWQRDFEETINGVYDYTEKNFYIVANNDLYIIDMQTGEDVAKPSYVGEKVDIRKVADGLIMFSASKADSVMKTDLNGDIMWKTNIMNDDYSSGRNMVQFTDNKIIISNNFSAYLLDAKTGKLKTDGRLVED